MLTVEQQQAYDALYHYAHNQMMAGVPDHKLHQAIINEGWEPQVAQTIIANLRAQRPQPTQQVNYYNPGAHVQQPRQRASSGGGGGGGRDMAIGGIVCLIGLVVTIGSYSAASGSGGGRYVVAWGAIVFGAIQFLKGLAGGR